jgi:hypothetical protein
LVEPQGNAQLKAMPSRESRGRVRILSGPRAVEILPLQRWESEQLAAALALGVAFSSRLRSLWPLISSYRGGRRFVATRRHEKLGGLDLDDRRHPRRTTPPDLILLRLHLARTSSAYSILKQSGRWDQWSTLPDCVES